MTETNKIIQNIKELIHDEVCMGTYGLVELELRRFPMFILGQTVYHKDIYNGNERMKVVGIRETEVELEGDYSGGTHMVCQRDWLPIKGLIIK